MNTDSELPSFIFWGGFTGLILLGISIIVFITYAILYNEAHDVSASLTVKNMSDVELALYLGYLITGGLGFLLALLIPFGHYLKSFHDPSVVSTKNSLHYETSDFEKNRILATPIKEVSSYQLAGTRGSKLLPERETSFIESANKNRFAFT